MATKTRYLKFGSGPDQPSTHDAAFRVAYKRQYRGAQAAAELETGSSDMLDSYAERFGAKAAAKLESKLAAGKGELVAEANAHAKADEKLLASEEVEVVEIETVSGPRLVWIDSVGAYEYAGVISDDEGSSG